MTGAALPPSLRVLAIAAVTLFGASFGGLLGCSGPLPHPYAPHPCTRPDMTGCLVKKVTLAGNEVLGASDIADKIATAASDHTLGGALENVPILSVWDRLTVDYETLDPFVLQRDLSRVERLYRVKGYYDAHARAARVIKVNKEQVRVEIAVEEGEPVLIASVVPAWVGAAPPEATINLIKNTIKHNKVGEPFNEDTFEDLKHKLKRALTDAGYAYADVKAHSDVDLIEHEARLTYTVETGPLCTFGEITLDGYEGLPFEKLRQAIHIKPGTTYSTDRIESAQNAVGDLRVAASVTAEPVLSTGEPRVTVIPVKFHITPTTLKTVKFGFGAEVGSRVEVHGLASWENRNLFGGIRHFLVEARPGVVINPLTFSTLFSKPASPIQPLFELRVHADLDQPGFIEARTKGAVSIAANLYQLEPLQTLGYLELAGKTAISRDFWSRKVSAALSLNMAFDQPLDLADYKALDSANGYYLVVVPSVQATGILDLRYDAAGKRDAINPHYGFYLSNDTQLAWLDSQDIRWKPEMRGYIPLGKKVTFALRAAAGFLYAFGGNLSKPPDPECPFGLDPSIRCGAQSPTGPATERARYIQVLQLRGFNSGGPNSNRGYGYNGIGPQEFIPNISQVNSNGQLTPIATGGSALWEASAELRFPVYEKLGATLFLDSSDVRWSWAQMTAPFAPHLSTGFGLRYQTPVGPFRADFGVRIPGAQVLGKTNCTEKSAPIYDPNGSPAQASCYLAPYFGQAGPIVLGNTPIPLTISLAIGESY